MTSEDIDGIFEKNHSLLIINCVVENKSVDIVLDEKGIITSVGEMAEMEWNGEESTLIDGTAAVALPGPRNKPT
ncbi:MAG: S-adenosylhomocysteine deaminase, partial [Methanoregula sp.]